MDLITSYKILLFPDCTGCVFQTLSLHSVDVFDSIGGFSLNSPSLKNQIAAILKLLQAVTTLTSLMFKLGWDQMIAASLLQHLQ